MDQTSFSVFITRYQRRKPFAITTAGLSCRGYRRTIGLSFAVACFYTSTGIDAATALSDRCEVFFGSACGVPVKQPGLLACPVFVIDASDVVRYAQIVSYIMNEPDYGEALEEVKKLLMQRGKVRVSMDGRKPFKRPLWRKTVRRAKPLTVPA